MTNRAPEPKMEIIPRCSHCGYTEMDAKFYGDHYLCKGKKDAPWNQKPLEGS